MKYLILPLVIALFSMQNYAFAANEHAAFIIRNTGPFTYEFTFDKGSNVKFNQQSFNLGENHPPHNIIIQPLLGATGETSWLRYQVRIIDEKTKAKHGVGFVDLAMKVECDLDTGLIYIPAKDSQGKDKGCYVTELRPQAVGILEVFIKVEARPVP